MRRASAITARAKCDEIMLGKTHAETIPDTHGTEHKILIARTAPRSIFFETFRSVRSAHPILSRARSSRTRPATMMLQVEVDAAK